MIDNNTVQQSIIGQHQHLSDHNHGSPERKQPVIFCDFDGTITESDNIIALVKHFDPPGWVDIVNGITERNISIKQGVGQLFSLFPASDAQLLAQYAIRHATIREGFGELLQYCEQHHIPFIVTSGGIDFFIYPILAEFPIQRQHIYCNHSDTSGETITITWPHACDPLCDNDCGMCKPTIIRAYPQDRYNRILIGDGITDFAAAKFADKVFARSSLIDLCQDAGIPFTPFESFYDIIDELHKEVRSDHE